ncbi:hypothetical protein DFS33DRAFT_1271200 [Desarmillaria ectypa]|nr:hypothetical protein DFS33DRAFT_1271200 [Desarmillaria ectypa]
MYCGPLLLIPAQQLGPAYSPFILRISTVHVVLTTTLSAYALPAISLGTCQGDVQGGGNNLPSGDGRQRFGGSGGPRQGPPDNNHGSHQPGQNGPENGPPEMNGDQSGHDAQHGGRQTGHNGQNGALGGNGDPGGNVLNVPPSGDHQPRSRYSGPGQEDEGEWQNGQGGPPGWSLTPVLRLPVPRKELDDR